MFVPNSESEPRRPLTEINQDNAEEKARKGSQDLYNRDFSITSGTQTFEYLEGIVNGGRMDVGVENRSISPKRPQSRADGPGIPKAVYEMLARQNDKIQKLQEQVERLTSSSQQVPAVSKN